jgi:hypothetical protein
MNDTATPKDLVFSTIGATQLPGAARSFPRVASSDGQYRRQSLHVSSLSPSIMRISHTPRKTQSAIQKSLLSLDQTLTRVDALGNPIGTTKFSVGFNLTIPGDVTLTEVRSAAAILLGFLLEADAANLTALYNAEA